MTPLELPDVEWFDEQFRLVDEDGETPLVGRGYRVVADNGQTWEGVTDADGLTDRIYTRSAIGLQVEVMPAQAKKVIE